MCNAYQGTDAGAVSKVVPERLRGHLEEGFRGGRAPELSECDQPYYIGLATT